MLGWRQPLTHVAGGMPPHRPEGDARIFPTKAIRIVSLAPDLADKPAAIPGAGTPQEPTSCFRDLSDLDLHQPPQVDEFMRSQALLLQLLSMLGGEFEEAHDDNNDLGVMGGMATGDGDDDGE